MTSRNSGLRRLLLRRSLAATRRAGTANHALGHECWHGGSFDYFRNTVMDANDWFANNSGLGRAAERHNDFGGILAAPFGREEHFSLFLRRCASKAADDNHHACSFPFIEAERSFRSRALSRRVPVAEWAHLARRLHGAIRRQLFQLSGTLNATSLRIDHFFSSHFSIFGRYNYAPSQTVSLSSPSELDTIPANTQTFTVGVNSELGK